MSKKIPVEGHPGFVRDMSTGAILNTNSSAIEKARAAKKNRKKQQEEIEEMKNDISEIKDLLKKLLRDV